MRPPGRGIHQHREEEQRCLPSDPLFQRHTSHMICDVICREWFLRTDSEKQPTHPPWGAGDAQLAASAGQDTHVSEDGESACLSVSLEESPPGGSVC